MDLSVMEKNCVRNLLQHEEYYLEDRLYEIETAFKRGRVRDAASATQERQELSYKLRLIRELRRKFGEYEVRASEEIPNGTGVGQG